ncbi:MAG: BspA family leucine-rich repeat surface protein [Enterococcus sp.]|nr:BspA family leucine-rich repeat surface protein [Enterococcus sp.]
MKLNKYLLTASILVLNSLVVPVVSATTLDETKTEPTSEFVEKGTEPAPLLEENPLLQETIQNSEHVSLEESTQSTEESGSSASSLQTDNSYEETTLSSSESTTESEEETPLDYEEKEKLAEWEYEKKNDYYLLTKYKGGANVVVPNKINGLPVKLKDINGYKGVNHIVGNPVFPNYNNITSITIKAASDGTKVGLEDNDLGGALQEWRALKTADLSGLDVSSVVNLANMFGACTNLTALNVSGWDTSNVTNMLWMFNMCYSITDLDLSSWNTSSVTSMRTMFQFCKELTNLNVSGWNTSNVTDMSYMFCVTPKLKYLDLTNFNLSNVPTDNMTNMFKSYEGTWSSEFSPVPLLVYATDSKLLNYDYYTVDKRVPIGPAFDANGGKFNDNSAIKYYIEKVAYQSNNELSPKLNLKSFETFKKENIPTKENSTFVSWNLTEGIEPTEANELLTPIKYLAVYNSNSSIRLVNGSFEQPVMPENSDTVPGYNIYWKGYNENEVPGWQTTASDKIIELIKSKNPAKLQAADGNQWAELNGTQIAALYQDIKTTPGETIYWQVAHRGRNGIDTAIVEFGSPNGQLVQQQEMRTGNTEWKIYSGYYTIPQGQTTTRFQFRSTSGVSLEGNYLDYVVFTNIQSTLTINFVDESGKQIRQPKIVTGYEGQAYDWTNTNPETNISGYILDTEKLPANAKGSFTKENQEITLTYKLISPNIPSQDVDNTKPDQESIYGIAYMPKQFSMETTELQDHGTQTISINKTERFDVGVRDYRKTASNWTLRAQLVWEAGKELPGSRIQTTNSEGTVMKNINNGTDTFNPETDLTPSDNEVTGARNVIIPSDKQSDPIMSSNNVAHNSVYNYNLGDVSLVIPETRYILPDTYTGVVEWNLSNVVS